LPGDDDGGGGMIQTGAEIEARETSGAVQILHLRAPELATRLSPGQAVLIQTGWGDVPYLRRTFYPIAIQEAGFSIRLPFRDFLRPKVECVRRLAH